jgi:SAM-dependent methyltransferase
MKPSYAELFAAHRGLPAHKWEMYFPIYDRYLSRFRGTQPAFLEIGMGHGGSMQIWQQYFEAGSILVGVDINPACLSYPYSNVEVVIGDQGSDAFWLNFLMGRSFDVILDDGSHFNDHIATTLLACWPFLNDGGVYLIEDTHGCYIHDDRQQAQRDFIGMCKRAIDDLHALWGNANRASFTPFATELASMHCYDSVIVLEKRSSKKSLSTHPQQLVAGAIGIPDSLAPAHQDFLTWRQSFIKAKE